MSNKNKTEETKETEELFSAMPIRCTKETQKRFRKKWHSWVGNLKNGDDQSQEAFLNHLLNIFEGK